MRLDAAASSRAIHLAAHHHPSGHQFADTFTALSNLQMPRPRCHLRPSSHPQEATMGTMILMLVFTRHQKQHPPAFLASCSPTSSALAPVLLSHPPDPAVARSRHGGGSALHMARRCPPDAARGILARVRDAGQGRMVVRGRPGAAARWLGLERQSSNQTSGPTVSSVLAHMGVSFLGLE